MITWYELQHGIRKLRYTLSILVVLFLARTFGRYEISVYADGLNYAKYHWRGKVYVFPTKPIEQPEIEHATE